MGVKFDFKGLDQAVEAEWPVRCKRPLDGGKVQEETFTARLRMLGNDETAALQKREVEGELGAFIGGFFVGLGREHDEVLDEDLKRKLLDRGYVRTALLAAYFQFAQGQEVKNSETPPA